MRVYYDRDADVNLIKSKKIAVVGYGSQGHAHALNLRDSGIKEVVVALRPGSGSVKKAKAQKLEVVSPAEAAKWADVMMVVTPDEGQAKLYADDLVDATVAQVKRVRVALAAVADDGDLLRLDQVDVGVSIIINAHLVYTSLA